MVEPGKFSFKDPEEAVLLADLYQAVTKTKGGWEYMKGYMGEGSGLGISIIIDKFFNGYIKYFCTFNITKMFTFSYSFELTSCNYFTYTFTHFRF